MEQDLQDLLALWLQDQDLEPPRRDALLARLRQDTAFRQAFVDEIHVHGMLRAVQSSEPRWLRLEDEIGWSGRQHGDVEALAQRIVEQRGRLLRLRRIVR